MKRFLLIPVLVLLCGCAGTSKRQSSQDGPLLPAWFWDTPSIPGAAFAVGYSPAYVESPAAFDSAFHDAAWRLFTDRRSTVTGDRALSKAGHLTMNAGNTVRQIVDTTGFSGFMPIVVRLDSIKTETMHVVLASDRSVEIDRKPAVPPQGQPESRTGQATGVGSAPLFFYESSSWIDAERRARLDLAAYAFSRVMSLQKTNDDNTLGSLVIETNAFLSNVQTVHRRTDPKTGTRTVWCTGKVDPNPLDHYDSRSPITKP